MARLKLDASGNHPQLMIYLIRCELTRAVKIGKSFDPEKRRAELQSACPGKLAVIATFSGSDRTEAELHARFADSRLQGEWFMLSDEDIATIQELKPKTARQLFAEDGLPISDIRYLLSAAVGFPVDIYGFDPEDDRPEEITSYRFDKAHASGQAGQQFSATIRSGLWTLGHTDPVAAAARYLEAWQMWLRDGGDPN